MRTVGLTQGLTWAGIPLLLCFMTTSTSASTSMLAGKVVVVTGASAGIGASLSRQLVKKGAKVVLAARSGDKLQALSRELGGEQHALPVVCDVTKREDHVRLLKESTSRFGVVDAWVNNAGRGITKSVLELTDEDLDDMMLVNTKSALYGMQVCVPYFLEREQGHVINVSSLLGRVAYVPWRSAYCASKHALNALTTACRLEVQQLGVHDRVHVSLFLPGLVGTEFGLNARHGGPDSRTLAGAQDVEEVAGVLVEMLERPVADEYSKPEYRDMMAHYYSAQRVEDIEARPPFPQPPSNSNT